MTSLEVKTAVASYLRYQRQCLLVSFERGPDDYALEYPDVLAVTDDMRLLEVEVKISVSDFRNDSKKRKWHPSLLDRVAGRTFFYAVPRELIDAVKPCLRKGAGLMSCGSAIGYPGNVEIIIKAERKADRISPRVFMKMMRAQTGTLISLAKALVKCERGKCESKNEGEWK